MILPIDSAAVKAGGGPGAAGGSPIGKVRGPECAAECEPDAAFLANARALAAAIRSASDIVAFSIASAEPIVLCGLLRLVGALAQTSFSSALAFALTLARAMRSFMECFACAAAERTLGLFEVTECSCALGLGAPDERLFTSLKNASRSSAVSPVRVISHARGFAFSNLL